MSESHPFGQVEVHSSPKRTLFQRIALIIPIKPQGAQWDSQVKFFETRLSLYVLIALVLAVTAGVIYWSLTQIVQAAEVRPLAVGMDLTVVLAPLLAAAAGVERSLETLFGIIEGNWRTLVAYLGRGLRWLQNTEAEVENARTWLVKVSAQRNLQLADLPLAPVSDTTTQPSSPTPQEEQPGVPAKSSLEEQFYQQTKAKLDEAKKIMDLAETRLKNAEQQLSQVTDSDHYKNAKRAATIFLGLLLGIVVATASSLQMFALMGIKVGNPKIDVIITGLVIGSGSTPVHSLINILQSAKDTLESAQGWLDANKNKGKP
jgi:hypothetical protein